MRLVRLVLVFALIAASLVGCQQNPEKRLLGSWTTDQGGEILFYETKSFVATQGPQTLEGTWSLTDNTVDLKIEKMAGKGKEETFKLMDRDLAKVAKQKPEMLERAKQGIEASKELWNKWTMTLSEDGKSLSTTLMGQPITFKKKE